MSDFKIEMIQVSSLIPYERNTKKHDKRQIDNVAESIRQYGWAQPIVVDKDNTVIIGHCRLLAAKKLKLEEVPCVRMEQLTPEQVRALRVVDNKSNESEWDMDFLEEELEAVDLSAFDFDFGLSSQNGEKSKEEEEESPYSTNINAPVYEIKGEKPAISELCDKSKAESLIRKINSSDIQEEVKEFLKSAAYRHLQFNYSKIAEYYAHADKEVQELFEESALVIIDFNSAIKNGFTKLSKRIKEMRDDE